ncbi:MAG: alpha/beta hydrolase-fold protein [Lacisediminihabitans sp.]
MGNSLTQLSLVVGPVPVVVYALAGLTLVVLVAVPKRHRALFLVASGIAGASVGLLLGWLVSDVWDSFEVALSVPTRLWLAAAVAAVGVAVASFRGVRTWRKVLAGCAIPLFVLAGGIGINSDVGEFPRVGDLIGHTTVRALVLPAPSTSSPSSSVAKWVPPVDLPLKGRVGFVSIPAVTSHFAARKAIVYLPPAALVPNAPALPVLEMMSGQPGEPLNLVTSGNFPEILDSFALAHRGLAPIVVIPDQLGAPQNNPMCVDSPLGNSASYLTVDVPAWVRDHLRVLPGRSDWAIGGFSQGGTCAIQLGAKYPALFGNIFDIAGQVAPHHGSIASTIRDAFGGSPARYQAATPLALLRAGAPYPDTFAVFVSGQDDARFGPGARVVATAAAAAGITVRSVVSPGTAHDWRTVRYALNAGIPLLMNQWGLK